MSASRPRDPAVVAALARRLGRADAVTLTNFAWFAARRGDRDTALAAARAAVARADAPRVASRTLERLGAGRTDHLLLALPDAPDAAPPPHHGAQALAAGVAAHAQGALAMAEACYRAATVEAATKAGAWNGIAVLHEGRGERAAADQAWALAVGDGHVAAIHDLALAWFRRGNIARARLVLSDAMAVRAPNAPLLFLAGYLAFLEQEPQTALPLLNAALALDDGLARAHFALGLVCERLDQHQRALDATRRGLQRSPWFVPQVWLLETGRDGAMLELPVADERATSAATDDVLLALGRSLLETTRLGEALAAFDQVLVRQPSHTAALFHRGVVLAKLRRYGEALVDWETVGERADAGALADVSRRHAQSARQLAALFAGA